MDQWLFVNVPADVVGKERQVIGNFRSLAIVPRRHANCDSPESRPIISRIPRLKRLIPEIEPRPRALFLPAPDLERPHVTERGPCIVAQHTTATVRAGQNKGAQNSLGRAGLQRLVWADGFTVERRDIVAKAHPQPDRIEQFSFIYRRGFFAQYRAQGGPGH
jgi:hypothetical protein